MSLTAATPETGAVSSGGPRMVTYLKQRKGKRGIGYPACGNCRVYLQCRSKKMRLLRRKHLVGNQGPEGREIYWSGGGRPQAGIFWKHFLQLR